MGGKKLKATSFDYAPFLYKENSIYNGYEVRYIFQLFFYLLTFKYQLR